MQITRSRFIQKTKGKIIVCYGAGKYLKYALSFLETIGINSFLVVDSDKEKWDSEIYGVRIQSPNVLKEFSGEEAVVLISSRNFSNDIEQSIETDYPGKFEIYKWPFCFEESNLRADKLYYERVFKPCEMLYEELSQNRIDKEEYLTEKRHNLRHSDSLILPRIPVIITTRCTLKCKECSNLIPYYSVPKDYPAEDILYWICNLTEAINELIILELVGGEPFLHKELKKILEVSLELDKIQRIELTTNGSIVPNDEIQELLQNDRVYVRISDYSCLVNSDRVVKVLEAKGINYELMSNMLWSKTGALAPRHRDSEALRSQYLSCGPAKICRTVLNGKLYACSKAASLSELGIVEGMECVDLMNKSGLRDRIKQFYKIDVSKACDYCDMGMPEEVFVKPAEQIRN